MEVKHDASRQEFYVELEGHRAHVAYQIHERLYRKPSEEKVLLLLW